MSSVDITVVVEDTVHQPRMRAEHGLSLHIEAGGYRILFDSGASALFLGNAKSLGLRLNDLDALVLSHNHYDHTGGVEFLVDLYSAAPPFFAHPKCFAQSYAKPENDAGAKPPAAAARTKTAAGEGRRGRKIGFPYPLGLAGLEKRGVSVHLNREPLQIHKEIWLSGEIPRNCPFENVGKNFFIDPQFEQVDDVIDDQALIVKTDGGLLVISGCCHSGVVNTLAAVQSLFPDVPVRALVGGLHLLHADAGRIKKSIDYLKSLDLRLVIAGHCTGFDALCSLRRTFGKRFQRLSVGGRFSLTGL